MLKTWIDPQEITIPEELRATVGGHPLVAKTLARRGIRQSAAARAFLDPAHYQPSPASDLPGLEEAVMRLEQAIQVEETILVWGDFDVDGQTSTTLLVEALRGLGAQVRYHIPVRATEGHGVKVEVLAKILDEDDGKIRLLLTCDTGIAAHAAVAYSNQRGVDVVVTDHHDPLNELPQAQAIVNPKLLPEGHPLGTLPGVGVAYEVIKALYHKTGRASECERFLDLVALGIVADVAEQTGDTRYLLQRGLDVLRQTPRLGLQTLMELAQINPIQLDEGHIGFGIGPRLNALGRLSDADPIVEFLTTQDAGRARVLATQLEGLNERRKLLTDQITQAALAQIERDRSLLDPAALVLAHAGWHTGVIGIVASRLGERFGKPTILLSIGEDGLARGSARSIEGIHITEAIATQKELLTSFGGHPGAAGLALPAAQIPEFRRGLGRAVQTQLGEEIPEASLQIDAYLPLAELSLDLVKEIERLAPFGAGNPSLTFASRNLMLVSHTPIGRSKEHLRLVVADQDENQKTVLWWNGASNPLPEPEVSFDLAYTIQASTYRGERQLQIQWVDFRTITEPAPKVAPEVPAWKVVDLRDATRPLARLQSLRAERDIQVWVEGEAKSRLEGLGRNELTPGMALAVWTTPPGPREWQLTLEHITPPQIYVFAINPKTDEPQAFLGRLAGLIKFALRSKAGEIDLAALAIATAQRENTVRMGILWLEAKGFIEILRREENIFWLAAGKGEENKNLAEIEIELNAMLAESMAYRAYFQNTQNSLT